MASRKIQLFGQYGNPDHLKVLITLNVTQAEGKRVEIHYHQHSKVPFLLNDKRPFLEVEEGRYLFVSNEICRFLLEISNKGKDLLSPKVDDEWIGWECTVLKEEVSASFLGGEPTAGLLSALKKVETNLNVDHSYLSRKKHFGLSDVIVWSTLYPVLGKESVLAPGLSVDFPNTFRWFSALLGEVSFSHALRQVTASHGFESVNAFMKGEVFMPRPLTPPPGADHPESSESTLAVTELEIAEATEVWSRGAEAAPKPRERKHPILPVEGEKNILITSALPYVNNVPHLGNIIGCVLSADVYSRFCRLRNYNTLYICGTDEYGTATETRAMREGVTPLELCIKYNTIHQEVYQWFNIDFDYFGRTPTPQQTEITQDIFWRLHERGFISEASVEQWFCEQCRRFLADRFVEGICPYCSYHDARGDQCDDCGKLINAVELKNPRCKACSKQPHTKSSNHLFLDLSKLEHNVDEWSRLSMEENFWSPNSRTITSTWIRDGLKPRSITRDLKWGTPVPLEGYTDKVFYVWFDAPIGYISITACYTDQWRRWWKNPSEVTLCQFMAKDNVPFHTVIFPSTLIGTEDNYTLLNVMSATEYLNYEDGKFSKSRGVGVFGNNAQESGIPADIFRFYLLYLRPETQDTVFSWHDLMMKNNTELLNNLGNFINRSLVFLKNHFNSTVPLMDLTPEDQELIAMVTKELRDYNKSLDGLKLRDGLKYILNVSRHGNGHIQAAQPWKLVKGTPEDRSRAGTLIGVCANISCLLSVMLQPFMPSVSEQIQQQLQAPSSCNILTDNFHPFLPTGHTIGNPAPLFAKIEPEVAQRLKDKYGGQETQSTSSPPKPLKTPVKIEEVNTGSLSAEEKSLLDDQLAKQSEVVRSLKATSTVTKEEIDREVAKLVEIKRKLGVDTSAKKKKGKKK